MRAHHIGGFHGIDLTGGVGVPPEMMIDPDIMG
jgi:hypothetical protein